MKYQNVKNNGVSSGKMIPLELKKAAKKAGELWSNDRDNQERIADANDESLMDYLGDCLANVFGVEAPTSEEDEELRDVARIYAKNNEVIDEYFEKDSAVKMKTKHQARHEARQQKITRIKEICDDILEKAGPLADESPSSILTMFGKGLRSRIEEIKTIAGEI